MTGLFASVSEALKREIRKKLEHLQCTQHFLSTKYTKIQLKLYNVHVNEYSTVKPLHNGQLMHLSM